MLEMTNHMSISGSPHYNLFPYVIGLLSGLSTEKQYEKDRKMIKMGIKQRRRKERRERRGKGERRGKKEEEMKRKSLSSCFLDIRDLSCMAWVAPKAWQLCLVVLEYLLKMISCTFMFKRTYNS